MINVLRGRRQGRVAASSDGVLITDDQPDVLSCPGCGRPLERMNGRCPGCGSLLLIGVQAKRASVFTAFGFVFGILIGSLVMGAMSSATRPVTAARAGGGSGTAGGSQGGGEPEPARPIVPTASKNALNQAAVINGRLVDSLAELRTVLGASPFDTVATAHALRALAADAQFGGSLTGPLARWQAATELSSGLASFYNSIRATAREGLAASLTNATAYKKAGTKMLAVFTVVPALDSATQDLAAAAGVTVPRAAPSLGAVPEASPAGQSAP